MKPSRIIGPPNDPHMLRWHLLRVGKLPRVYLHRFIRSDDDRALHDHPWWFISIVLTGTYIEHTPYGKRLRRSGSIAYRNINHKHRIELVPGRPVRTLFITGTVVRKWGFWCPDYVATGDHYADGRPEFVYVGEHWIPSREFDGCD